MRFDVDDTLDHPLDLVFRTHRDHLIETMALLEDVDRVELRSQTRHADGVVEQLHQWRGSPKVLPALIRPMVPPHLLEWRQRTWWDSAEHLARWEIDVPGLGKAVECKGTNVYVAEGKGTKISVGGDFWFRPEQIEGLAKALPPGAAPMVERVMLSLVVPLVKRSGSAVARYLDAQRP